jgi:hypothetical protein
MDYLELLDICAYDVDAVSAIIEEVLSQIGLEELEPESDSKERR